MARDTPRRVGPSEAIHANVPADTGRGKWRPTRAVLPLVGRETLLARLEGDPRLAVADARWACGVGKSRLARELVGDDGLCSDLAAVSDTPRRRLDALVDGRLAAPGCVPTFDELITVGWARLAPPRRRYLIDPSVAVARR